MLKRIGNRAGRWVGILLVTAVAACTGASDMEASKDNRLAVTAVTAQDGVFSPTGSAYLIDFEPYVDGQLTAKQSKLAYHTGESPTTQIVGAAFGGSVGSLFGAVGNAVAADLSACDACNTEIFTYTTSGAANSNNLSASAKASATSK